MKHALVGLTFCLVLCLIFTVMNAAAYVAKKELQENCAHEWVDLGVDYVTVDFWSEDQQPRRRLRCSKCGAK